MKSVKALYRLTIIFLLGAVVISVLFVYQQTQINQLISDVKLVNERKSVHQKASLQAVRFSESIYSRVYNYKRYIVDMNHPEAKIDFLSDTIRNIPYLLSNYLTYINFTLQDDNDKTIKYKEVEQLRALRPRLEKLTKLITNMNFEELATQKKVDGDKTAGLPPSLIKSAPKYWKTNINTIFTTEKLIYIAEEELAIFSSIHVAAMTFSRHFDDINQSNKAKIEKKYSSLIIWAIIIFIAQFIIFIISSVFDFSGSLFDISHDNLPKIKGFLLISTIFIGVSYLLDQLILQMEIKSSNISSMVTDLNDVSKGLIDDATEIRLSEFSLRTKLGGLSTHITAEPRAERTTDSFRWYLKSVGKVSYMLFQSVSNYSPSMAEKIYNNNDYIELKKIIEKYSEIKDQQERIMFIVRNIKLLDYLVKIKTYIELNSINMRNKAELLKTELDNLSLWQTIFIVLSTIFQAIALFMIVKLFLLSHQISGRNTISINRS